MSDDEKPPINPMAQGAMRHLIQAVSAGATGYLLHRAVIEPGMGEVTNYLIASGLGSLLALAWSLRANTLACLRRHLDRRKDRQP